MRSPTLLTGVTGAVAVMVLVYVGLTAMNLQPHITFGDPPVRVASVDATPEKPAVSPSAETAPPPVTTPPPSPSAAVPPVVSAPPAQPPQVPDQTRGPDAAGSAEPAPQAAPAETATPAAPPPSAAEMPSSPAAPVPPVAPPVVAGTSPEPTKAAPTQTQPAEPEPTSPATASPGQASPSTERAPPPVAASLSSAAPGIPAEKANPAVAEPDAAPPVAASSLPSSRAEDSSIEDRMAPPPIVLPMPPTPPTPRVASVPTPLARPKQPEVERLAKAESLRADDGDGSSVKGAPTVAPATPAPSNQSAALAPQPEKPAGEAGAIEQSNGALKPVDLARPFAERAGILTIGGRSVQLAGIVPTDPERSCTGPNGKAWPCGTLARTALRSFLLGRTITCDVADPAWQGAITAECRFARVSLGEWLARNGWAEVASGSPLTAAAEDARKEGRGVYGNDPRKRHQSTLAPEPPKEDPLNPI